MTTPLIALLSFLLVQRLVELRIARRHENILRSRGAVEVDKQGYRYIVAMHAAFFVSLVIETVLLKRHVSHYWVLLLSIFAAAQVLRYWAISSLGIYWNTKILIERHHRVIRKGPYRFIRHPNYLAVVIEICIVPLILSCYLTAVTFSLLNALALTRRIRMETRALNGEMKELEKKPDGITI